MMKRSQADHMQEKELSKQMGDAIGIDPSIGEDTLETDGEGFSDSEEGSEINDDSNTYLNRTNLFQNQMSKSR